MKLIYETKKIEEICTNLKDAQKFFAGNKQLALSLLSRVNALEQAPVINDIIHIPVFHFHNLFNIKNKKYKGYFAIDVRHRNDAWRIVLQPLDNNEKPFNPCNIDQISKITTVVKIKEVTNHYE